MANRVEQGEIVRVNARSAWQPGVTRVSSIFQCEGANDDVVIQAAIDALPDFGGLVDLSAGEFNASAPLKLPSNIVLSGQAMGMDTYNSPTAGRGTFIVLAGGSNCDIIVNSDPANGNQLIIVRNMTLWGNKGIQASGDAIHFTACSLCRLESVRIHSAKEHGIHLSGTGAGDRLEKCIIRNSGDNSIHLASGITDAHVIGNQCVTPGGNGIYNAGGMNFIIENHFGNGESHGIYNFRGDYTLIHNNVFNNNDKNGIYIQESDDCVITGNMLRGNGELTNNVYDGIRMGCSTGGHTCNYNIVHNNKIFWESGNKMKYCIGEVESAGDVDYNSIQGNMVRDGQTGQILKVGANTIVRNNPGHKTENHGTAASVADGGTIAHGLAAAPTYVSVAASAAGEIVTVASVDGTNITVAIKDNDDSTGTTQTIYWEARV